MKLDLLKELQPCKIKGLNSPKFKSHPVGNNSMALHLLLKGIVQPSDLRRGFLMLVIGLALATASPAQLDDTKIAFTSERDGNREIYVMDADGGNPVNLTHNKAKDNSPSWSPDGTQIAFSSDRDGNFEIYIMNADGSSPINLTKNLASDTAPSWSPAPLAVSPQGKLPTQWGQVKRIR